MNVQATLEVLHAHPGNEHHLRQLALELGSDLGLLEDSELARLDSGLARLQGLVREAPAWVQGFFCAMSSLLSGAQQQRRQVREQRSQVKGMEDLERSLRKDWRSLLGVMEDGLIRPSALEKQVGMNRSQVSRNLGGMVKAGLLEHVSVREQPEAQDGRARLYRLTAQGRWLQERLGRRPVPSPAPAPSPSSTPSPTPSPAVPQAPLYRVQDAVPGFTPTEPRGTEQTVPTLPVGPLGISSAARRRAAPRASVTAIDSAVLSRPAPSLAQALGGP